MSKKKNKFDLSNLVHDGAVKEGDTLYFVSDPKMCCVVKKMPNHEFKVAFKTEILTVHQAAVKFLGQEPPDHACRWLRTNNGKTLYELWQNSMMEEAA
jgi:hypothetical protein